MVAGALTPAEGLRVIAIRSRLMARMAGQGAVALLELDADAAARLLHTLPGVSVAGLLSPRQTVIAGPPLRWLRRSPLCSSKTGSPAGSTCR
ncbi:hypothetical protein NIIDMKKI_12200 [Mycobacterium kansasii]|uniref:Malonyl-CoA:ACP transacylase (MAT) domain-containing protein n=1 Tax=Mycobacterium kansasii TaxID=1768 RepID=A0A7G1I6D9_MYCKA|nr:hypothetical protein NIIDMKKI_12200 [Mycobacterium kansasii]